MTIYCGNDIGTVEERVQRGIDKLNAEGPDNWVDMIDLDRFDMASPCRCILGFTYADDSLNSGFFTGANRLCLRGPTEFKLGFNSDGTPNDFAALQAEWHKRIEQIREERKTNV